MAVKLDSVDTVPGILFIVTESSEKVNAAETEEYEKFSVLPLNPLIAVNGTI
ncbi:MAG: hypothetical protein NZ730_08940 [Porticoccaceae bacterium]|nr:hypothetical protein [Porticoccaceae bacterium]